MARDPDILGTVDDPIPDNGDRPTYLYLIHFDTPLHHARHYLGATYNLKRRLRRHATNQGSRLVAAVNAANISWQLVKVWYGSFTLESITKTQKNGPQFCPICRTTPRRLKNATTIDMAIVSHVTPLTSEELTQ